MKKIKRIAAGALLAGVLSVGVLAGAGAARRRSGDPVDSEPAGPGIPPPGHLQRLPLVPPPGYWPVPPGWVNHW